MEFSEEQANWLKENSKLLESRDYPRIFVKAQYDHSPNFARSLLFCLGVIAGSDFTIECQSATASLDTSVILFNKLIYPKIQYIFQGYVNTTEENEVYPVIRSNLIGDLNIPEKIVDQVLPVAKKVGITNKFGKAYREISPGNWVFEPKNFVIGSLASGGYSQVLGVNNHNSGWIDPSANMQAIPSSSLNTIENLTNCKTVNLGPDPFEAPILRNDYIVPNLKDPRGELLEKLQNKKEFLEFLRSSGGQLGKKEIKKLEKEIKSLEKTILRME